MLSPESGLTGVACDNCIFEKKSGSDIDTLITCVGLPTDFMSGPFTVVSRGGYCALGIQKLTGKKFADILSEAEARKGAENNES